MRLKIERDTETGFCFGVKRAIDIVTEKARTLGRVETLGAIVHNRPVLRELAGMGVRIAENVEDIRGDVIATSAHGISPDIERELRGRHIDVVSTVCPFVQRAQLAAERLAEAGFYVVVYGDANHPEVEGVLGWAEGRGMATLDESRVCQDITSPYRIGILSQTTQIPAHFTDFVKKVVELALTKDTEIRVIDTICHEIRRRQASAFELAGRVDAMLVVGGHNSANTSRLARLCSRVTRARLIETSEEIDPSWFEDGYSVGITAGTSTSEDAIEKVVTRLKALS